MGTVQVGTKYCEVTRRITEVQPVHVRLIARLADGSEETISETHFVDLSPAALRRLAHAVNGALCQPSTKAKQYPNRWVGPLFAALTPEEPQATKPEKTPCPATQKSQPPA